MWTTKNRSKGFQVKENLTRVIPRKKKPYSLNSHQEITRIAKVPPRNRTNPCFLSVRTHKQGRKQLFSMTLLYDEENNITKFYFVSWYYEKYFIITYIATWNENQNLRRYLISSHLCYCDKLIFISLFPYVKEHQVSQQTKKLRIAMMNYISKKKLNINIKISFERHVEEDFCFLKTIFRRTKHINIIYKS